MRAILISVLVAGCDDLGKWNGDYPNPTFTCVSAECIGVSEEARRVISLDGFGTSSDEWCPTDMNGDCAFPLRGGTDEEGWVGFCVPGLGGVSRVALATNDVVSVVDFQDMTAADNATWIDVDLRLDDGALVGDATVRGRVFVDGVGWQEDGRVSQYRLTTGKRTERAEGGCLPFESGW